MHSCENIDPQMPSERPPRPCVRDFNEKSSLPLQGESEGPKPGGILRRIRYFRQRAKVVLYQPVSWLCWEAAANTSLLSNSLICGKVQGIWWKQGRRATKTPSYARNCERNSLLSRTGKYWLRTGLVLEVTATNVGSYLGRLPTSPE